MFTFSPSLPRAQMTLKDATEERTARESTSDIVDKEAREWKEYTAFKLRMEQKTQEFLDPEYASRQTARYRRRHR